MNTLAHTTLAKARLALVGLVLGGAALLGGAGETRGEVVEVGSFEEFLNVLNTQAYVSQGLKNYDNTSGEVINPFTRDGRPPIDNNYHLGLFERGGVNTFVGYLAYPFSSFYIDYPELLAGSYNRDTLAIGNKPDDAMAIHDANDDNVIMKLIGNIDANGNFYVDYIEIAPGDEVWGNHEFFDYIDIRFQPDQYQGPIEFNGEQDINQMPASSDEGELIVPSINLIPEASTLALLAAGGMTSLFRRRKARREAR